MGIRKIGIIILFLSLSSYAYAQGVSNRGLGTPRLIVKERGDAVTTTPRTLVFPDEALYQSGSSTHVHVYTSAAVDVTFLKLDCSNDPLTGDLDLGTHNLTTTGTLNCPTIYNSAGNLKIMPDVQGHVGLFGDTNVANDADGKIFSVNRRATEGDTYLNFYINHDQTAYIDSNWDISIRSNLASGVIELGAIPTNIVRLIGTVNAIGEPSGTENLPLRHYGYITADAAQRYVSWLVNDTDDYYSLTRSDTNILGLKIDMPLDLVGWSLSSVGEIYIGSNGIGAVPNIGGELIFWSEGANDYYTRFAPQTQTENVLYALPAANPTANSQALLCSTAGVWSWGTNFGTNDIATSGTLGAGAITGTSLTDGTLTIDDGLITGGVSATFSGVGTFGGITLPSFTPSYVPYIGTDGVLTETINLTFSGAAVTIGAALTLGAGSITDTSGTISFGNEILNTTGIIQFDDAQATGVYQSNYVLKTHTHVSGAHGSNPATINVLSTAGFNSSGWLGIRVDSSMRTVKYTGTTATSFTGCTWQIWGDAAYTPLDTDSVIENLVFCLNDNGSAYADTGTNQFLFGVRSRNSATNFVIQDGAGTWQWKNNLMYGTGFRGSVAATDVSISAQSTGELYLYSSSGGVGIAMAGSGHSGTAQIEMGQNVTLPADNRFTKWGAANDALAQFIGTQFQIQSDVITATDSLLLRGGTNGIAFNIGATEQIILTDGKLAPTTTNDIDLGDSTHLYKDIWEIGKHYYRDNAIYTWSSADGWLNLVADTGVEVNAPILNVGALYVAGAIDAPSLPTGTLAAPPAGLGSGDFWTDTTTSATDPIVRCHL